MIDRTGFKNVEFFDRAMALPFSEVVRHASVVSDNVQGVVMADSESFTGVCYALVKAASERLNISKAAPRFRVFGKRWNDVHGNTYHSVKILDAQSNRLVYIPFEYGYGEQFLQTACDWLQANGHLDANQCYSTVWLRESGVEYEVLDVPRKRDL